MFPINRQKVCVVFFYLVLALQIKRYIDINRYHAATSAKATTVKSTTSKATSSEATTVKATIVKATTVIATIAKVTTVKATAVKTTTVKKMKLRLKSNIDAQIPPPPGQIL